MTIRGRIAVMISVPVGCLILSSAINVGILNRSSRLIRQVSRSTFLPVITEDMPRLQLYADSIASLLNADRDAYQAYLAEVQLATARDPAVLEALQKENELNMQQVRERVDLAAKGFDAEMKAAYDRFNSQFDIWQASSREATRLSQQVAENARDSLAAHAESQRQFAVMRTTIDQMQDLLAQAESGAGADTEAARGYRSARELMLNADRDAYQAYLAQCQAVSAESPEALAAADKENAENIEQVAERMAKARDLADPKTREAYAAFETQFAIWKPTSRQVVEHILANQPLEVNRAEKTLSGQKAFQELRQTVDDLGGMFEARIAASSKQLDSKGKGAVAGADDMVEGMGRATALSLAIAGGALLVSVVLAVWFTRRIISAIGRVTDSLNAASNQTGAAAGQVASASQALAQQTSQAAANLQETTAGMEEVASVVRRNADSAARASELSRETQSIVSDGSQSMVRLNQSITEIKSAADQTAKIVKTIDEIAFQTNLLALNAAVEAARAGEAGKGFAVVAEEVRALAMRAAEAARNTSTMIQASITNTHQGVTLVNEMDGSLRTIAQGVTNVTSLIEEIATAGREQSGGIDVIKNALGEMDRLTQSNAATAEESASAAEELSAQAAELKRSVEDLVQLVGGKVLEPEPAF